MTNGSYMLVLLGASTGGPEALKAFFEALPNRDLPVCFIVANHIDEGFVPHLRGMFDEHPNFDAEVIDQAKPLEAGKIYITPVTNQLCFRRQSQVRILDEAWGQPYAPNINQFFLASLEHKANEKLAIIFSGMDDDGSQSAKALSDAEVEIWCQSELSCIQDSMPRNMIKTGQVIYKDSPSGLALQLVDLLDSIYPMDQSA